MLVTAMVTAVEAQPRAISIIDRAYATEPASAPPSADGTLTPMSPSSARPASSDSGSRSVSESAKSMSSPWPPVSPRTSVDVERHLGRPAARRGKLHRPDDIDHAVDGGRFTAFVRWRY